MARFVALNALLLLVGAVVVQAGGNPRPVYDAIFSAVYVYALGALPPLIVRWLLWGDYRHRRRVQRREVTFRHEDRVDTFLLERELTTPPPPWPWQCKKRAGGGRGRALLVNGHVVNLNEW